MTQSDLVAQAARERQRVTGVIPAAGRGTRLRSGAPKILYPVAGRVMLDWLLEKLLPVCSHVVVVVSPQAEPAVAAHLARRGGADVSLALQPEPVGMGDAVLRGLEQVQTAHACLVWGDQVALRPETIARTLLAHLQRPEARITLPLLRHKDPYIHFVRDAAGRLIGVLQKREGDAMPDVGESDAGLFVVTVHPVREALRTLAAEPGLRGALTGEINFLPIIPLLVRAGSDVLAIGGLEEQETQGVNTPEDAEAVARYLCAQADRGA